MALKLVCKQYKNVKGTLCGLLYNDLVKIINSAICCTKAVICPVRGGSVG